MRSTFLQEVAARYLELSQTEKNILLVFPNKRAGVFFRKELANLNPQVQWMPELMSSEEFVRRMTQLKQADPVALLFEFYTVYQLTEGEKAEPFDVFSTWAPQLLHDFQEIDLYCVDAVQLFGTIDDAYALKYWSPDGEIITENQQQYLRFWSRMGKWYHALREHLQQKGLATSAMAYRQLAENIRSYAETITYSRIVFAGFNALNASEQTFMRHLQKSGKAEVLWDADPYYVENSLNEAGHFLRKYRNEWSLRDLNFCEPHLDTVERNIHIVGVAKNLGQSLVAGSILDHLSKLEPDLTSTSLVLCDEQLLMPVLEVLPAELDKVNITMGYPMHLLPVSSLFSLVFDLQQKLRMSGKTGEKEPAFYFRDILRLLRNPSLAGALDGERLQPLIDRIVREKRIFFPLSTLLFDRDGKDSVLKDLAFLFQPWENDPGKAIHTLQRLVAFLKDYLIEQEKADEGLDMEALYAVNSLLQQIDNLRVSFSGFSSIRTLQRIFQQLLKSQTFPFYGEPLTGLQLMGLLETRNLDFKNLILLSVNEGTLPAAKSHRSFIPSDIARNFGLPTYRERDAVFAYHFYRMIQRAENVWLVYNTETDELGKGEQSRYITQLMEELKSPHTKISRETYVPRLKEGVVNEVLIQKTPAVLEQLRKRIDGSEERHHLSPTALAAFNNCSLQFYFRYLSGVKVEDTKDDDIGADMTGTVVHYVLEKCYQPLEKKVLKKEDLLAMKPRIESLMRESFSLEGVDERDLSSGNNLLTYKGVEKMLGNFIDAEIRILEALAEEVQVITIEQVEKDLHFQMEIEVAGVLETVSFKGRTDRIDRIGSDIRVVDYKTGNVQAKDVKLNEQSEIIDNPEKAKALQLMQYALMVPKEYADANVIPGIISLRKPSEGLIALNVNKKVGLMKEEREETRQIFATLAHDMLNPEVPFAQTEDPARCVYCDFATICNR
ncbi:MAG: hypothetical protein RL040_850 [Bacteroidota bacterium]